MASNCQKLSLERRYGVDWRGLTRLDLQFVRLGGATLFFLAMPNRAGRFSLGERLAAGNGWRRTRQRLRFCICVRFGRSYANSLCG